MGLRRQQYPVARMALQPLNHDFRDQLRFPGPGRALDCEDVLHAQRLGQDLLFFLVEVVACGNYVFHLLDRLRRPRIDDDALQPFAFGPVVEDSIECGALTLERPLRRQRVDGELSASGQPRRVAERHVQQYLVEGDRGHGARQPSSGRDRDHSFLADEVVGLREFGRQHHAIFQHVPIDVLDGARTLRFEVGPVA